MPDSTLPGRYSGEGVSSLTHGSVAVPKAILREMRFYAKTYDMHLWEYVVENHRLCVQETERMYGGVKALRERMERESMAGRKAMRDILANAAKAVKECEDGEPGTNTE